ncbi:L-glutamate gamma-semialdehyde dehydrogenase [Saccharicrinis sp. FJH54]|uniref:L-glutamate gamma-semialdehyde dehydrogenase n=1 Tax=Saccharicrinis sp. FJH54 TaxID=3344665 RepID=UPI0035D522AB
MGKGFYHVPVAKNEPVMSYAPGSKERAAIKKKLAEMKAVTVDIPMVIGGKAVYTDVKKDIRPPHNHSHLLGQFNYGDKSHVKMAIDAALAAKDKWAALEWQHRAAIFLKCADLIAGPYRDKINAATMLGQSKNIFQAEIDAACEMADFFRFGVKEMVRMYDMQPESSTGIWNYNNFRPLEGFVFALTPFNFTSIAGNLPAAPAMLGNTVVWKPSRTAIYSAHVLMEVFIEAGVPAGVINMIFTSGPETADVVFEHPEFAGIHFTGSTGVFQGIWNTIGKNIHKYKTYPRIVGETGGKDFIFADPTANPQAVATAMTRGAFEYQGQKCSAASRAYIPKSMWNEVKESVGKDLAAIKMGDPEDFSNFVNAVIDKSSFNKLSGYIEEAKKSADAEVVFGGVCDDTKGYFIQPTIIEAKVPDYITMQEELFGPVLTVYVYEDDKMEETLETLNSTSMYALTGAIFSQDRYNITHMVKKLENAAGNFYINDKPTGAVVGQQPFGGSRGSGTNDKAGSIFNMLRWVSVRTIKENFVSPKDFRYPFMEAE